MTRELLGGVGMGVTQGCSEDVRAVIQFVASTRAQDYKELSNRVGIS
jgi:hypothetical protein